MLEKMFNGQSFIDNEFIDTESKITIKSPIDGKEIGSVSALNKKQIDLAFDSAQKAFHKWSFTSYKERILLVKKFADYFLEEKEFLANLITLEVGKPYKDSLIEVERSYEYILETIKVFEKEMINPTIIDENIHNIKGKIGKFYNVPIGVVLAISPFNYPINLSIAKIVPTILVGNTIVFKPATYGSLVCSQLSKYILKAGFPIGVFNLVTGKGSEIGDYILENKNIAGVTFTGSTEIGKKIASKLFMKNIVLELGGKDAAIVLEDADLEKTAKEIIKGAFSYSGQRCTAIKRIIVLEEVADSLAFFLVKEISKLTVGNPFDNVDVSPLIDTKSCEFVKSLIEDGIKHGGKLLYGGNVVGYNLLEPTLIDNVSVNSKLAWEEPFGPVLPIIRVKTITEAIGISNASNFGLQSSVFTKDIAKANLIARHLNVGTININKSSSRGPDIFPFVGVKDSGFGVQGILDSMKSMTRIKGIVENN